MKHKNDICWSCGASEGLHHYANRQCPKNGREETRHDEFNNKAYPQKWEETVFVDSGIKEFEMKAVKYHDELVERLADAKYIIKVMFDKIPLEQTTGRMSTIISEIQILLDKVEQRNGCYCHTEFVCAMHPPIEK